MSDSADAVDGGMNVGGAGGLGLSAPAGHRRHAVGGPSNRDWWPDRLNLAIDRKSVV